MRASLDPCTLYRGFIFFFFFRGALELAALRTAGVRTELDLKEDGNNCISSRNPSQRLQELSCKCSCLIKFGG